MRLNPSLQSLLSGGGLLGHLSYGCVLSKWVLHTVLQEFAYGVENSNNTTAAFGGRGDMIHHVPLCPVIPDVANAPTSTQHRALAFSPHLGTSSASWLTQVTAPPPPHTHPIEALGAAGPSIASRLERGAGGEPHFPVSSPPTPNPHQTSHLGLWAAASCLCRMATPVPARPWLR